MQANDNGPDPYEQIRGAIDGAVALVQASGDMIDQQALIQMVCDKLFRATALLTGSVDAAVAAETELKRRLFN